MKQSTLNFAAAKRTASNSYAQVGKPKLAVPKPKTFQPISTNKRDDDIDDYDDVVIKESSSEEIEEVESGDSKPSRVGSTDAKAISSIDSDVNETLTRKALLQTKKFQPSKPGKEKVSNVKTTSQPFKTLNLDPEDLQKKVDELPELDPSDKRWNKLHKAAKAKLGGVPSSFLVFCPIL